MTVLEQTTPASHTLKSRMIRAASWLVAGNLTAQAVRLLSSLLLTRLLVPEAFGLMAAVNTLYFGLLMFSDLGIWQCVVRSSRGHDQRFLGTAWVIQFGRGALLTAMVLLLAALVYLGQAQGWFTAGTVYDDAQLPWLMVAFAPSALIQGMESMQLATAQRDMLGRQFVRLELTTQLLAVVVTTVGAWLTQSVWALVTGTVVAALIKTALSHVSFPGPVTRPCWDRDAAQEILGFGKWVFLSSLIGFAAANGEKLILGAYLSLAAFGVFAIASNLLSALIGVLSTINGRVVFPSLSTVLREGNPASMRQVYVRMQQLADVLLGVCSGALFLLGHRLVDGLYDARYADAGWMLQWLALGLLAMRYQVLEQLMFASGRPGWVSANNALRALALLVLIPLGASLAGERGAVVGVVLSQFASWPLSLRFKHQQGLLTWASERWWLPGLCLGCALGGAMEAALRVLIH